MHRVHYKTEFRRANSLPVHQFVDGLKIRSKKIERLDITGLRGQRWHAICKNDGEFLLDLRDDGRQRGTSVARLKFYAVPPVGIVAGRDHNAAGRASLAHKQ